MATLTLNVPSGDSNGIDMSQILGYDDTWDVVSVTSSTIKFSDGEDLDYFMGSGLKADASGNFSGTVTSWKSTDLASGFTYAQLTGVSVSAASVQAAIENNTEATLVASLLSGADTITGSSGKDVIDGHAGADTMTGGAGNDIYYVDLSTDKVVEQSGGGTDLVRTKASSYTLASNVENGAIVSSGTANLTGNSLNNVLTAGAGNNAINGSTGTDKVDYSTATAAVKVSLAVTTAQATGGSGSDTLTSIENLLGSKYNDTLTGSGVANTLTGGAGSDRVTGGGGADRFVLNSTSGSDTITDFVTGSDKLAIDPKAILVGDKDSTLEGAISRSAPGGFAKTAELVVFTSNISGSITTSTAAAKIGAATSAYAAGAHALFAVDNGSSSALYLFTSSGADATVSAGELTLLATLSATPSTTTADYLFGT